MHAVAEDETPGAALTQIERGVLVKAVFVYGVHEGRDTASGEGHGPVVRGALGHGDVLDGQRFGVEKAEPVAERGAARPVRGGEAEELAVGGETAYVCIGVLAGEEAVSAVLPDAEAAAAAADKAPAIEPEGQLVRRSALGAFLFERLGGLLCVAAGRGKYALPVAGDCGRKDEAVPSEKAQGVHGAVEAAELARFAAVIGENIEHRQRLARLGALFILFVAQRGEDHALVRESVCADISGGGQLSGLAVAEHPEV